VSGGARGMMRAGTSVDLTVSTILLEAPSGVCAAPFPSSTLASNLHRDRCVLPWPLGTISPAFLSQSLHSISRARMRSCAGRSQAVSARETTARTPGTCFTARCRHFLQCFTSSCGKRSRQRQVISSFVMSCTKPPRGIFTPHSRAP
jgi:hypothetical protein